MVSPPVGSDSVFGMIKTVMKDDALNSATLILCSVTRGTSSFKATDLHHCRNRLRFVFREENCRGD